MKFTLALIAAVWLYAFFFGRFLHDKPHANKEALGTEVSIFRDVPLPIVKKEIAKDGSWRLTAETTYRGKPAGLQVTAGPGWLHSPEKNIPGLEIYEGPVTFLSLGEESDRLVEMLNEIYIAQFPSKPMVKSLAFEGFSLEGNPAALDKAPVKLKLFCDPGKKDHYAELYLNLDLSQNRLTLMEKDTEYRKPILWALRGE